MGLGRIPQRIRLVDLDLDRAREYDVEQILGHGQQIGPLVSIGPQGGPRHVERALLGENTEIDRSTAPEDCPKSTMSPRGARQSSEAKKVSLPTESYTTGTISPLVISLTRSTKFSRV